jgi:hypothetical protein
MTDYSGLAHRLRTEWDDVEIDCEAADAIEAQAKRIEELEAALKPFAAYYVTDCTNLDPDYCVICEADEEENNLTVGLFRAAHKALEDK